MASLEKHRRQGRGKMYPSILDTIGDTPLVRLPRLSAELKPKGEVLAKLEFFNPLSSVKDRIGVAMIEALEAEGLHPARARRSWSPPAATPASRSPSWPPPRATADPGHAREHERGAAQDAAAAGRQAGADARREGHARRRRPRPRDRGGDSRRGDAAAVREPANPPIHRVSTAEEIWNDTAGGVDAVVAGVGTGGTITGVGQVLKPRKPSLTHDRGGAGGLGRALRRRAGAAQDPGHRRGLRPRRSSTAA